MISTRLLVATSYTSTPGSLVSTSSSQLETLVPCNLLLMYVGSWHLFVSLAHVRLHMLAHLAYLILYRDPVALCVSEGYIHAHVTFPFSCHCIVIDCFGCSAISRSFS